MLPISPLPGSFDHELKVCATCSLPHSPHVALQRASCSETFSRCNSRLVPALSKLLLSFCRVFSGCCLVVVQGTGVLPCSGKSQDAPQALLCSSAWSPVVVAVAPANVGENSPARGFTYVPFVFIRQMR